MYHLNNFQVRIVTIYVTINIILVQAYIMMQTLTDLEPLFWADLSNMKVGS